MPLEPGRPTDPGTLYKPAGVDGAGLPKGVAERALATRERADSLHRLLPTFEERSEPNIERMKAQHELTRLQQPPMLGGFGLSDDDPRVISQKQQIARLTVQIDRINARYERARSLWQPAARVATTCEQWLQAMRFGTALEDFEVAPKLNGKEDILTAIERLRRRCRELKADLHRVESAPFPSSHAKQRARAQIEELAQAGAPIVSNLIEHDKPIQWPQRALTSQVANVQAPAVAFSETDHALAFVLWLHKAAAIAAIEAEIDAESDDPAALSHEDRERQAAEIAGDLLSVERDEASLVWKALEQGLPCEFREDCHVLAILGARLVTVPPAEQHRSSPMHAAYSLLGGNRR